MTTLTPTKKVAPAAIPELPLHRFSVAEYHEMLDKGILQSGAPFELLEGLVVEKMTKYPRHSIATQNTRDLLQPIVAEGWTVNDQEPISLEDSEPEPDLSVIRGKRGEYTSGHPEPKDVGMVAETADSSLDHDRGWKKSIYAKARIPVYWIINLVDNQVEVYTEPYSVADRFDYKNRRDYQIGEQVPVVLDGKQLGTVAVKAMIP